MSTRLLDFGLNARDLGGLRLGKDRRTRYGCLMRSEFGDDLPLQAMIVDLRSDGEVRGHPPLRRVTHMPIATPRDPIKNQDGGPTPSGYTAYYRAMLIDALPAIERVLGMLAIGDPVLVACQTGKDRTAVVIALTLRGCGVRLADVVSDYHLTYRMLTKRSTHRSWTWSDHLDPCEYERRIASPSMVMRTLIEQIEIESASTRAFLIGEGISAGLVKAASDAFAEPR